MRIVDARLIHDAVAWVQCQSYYAFETLKQWQFQALFGFAFVVNNG